MSLPPFQAVLDEHGPPLWRFLAASLGPHDGADCYQETLMAALRAYPSLHHDGNLRAWLFTIAHRKAIDASRVSARQAAPVGAAMSGGVLDQGAAARGLADTSPTDGASLPDGELWDAVRGLPPKQRSAVVLRHVAGWPYSDIAALLACSPDAARQNVKAGLDRLRDEVRQ